jgi:lipid A 3-O-deacylase
MKQLSMFFLLCAVWLNDGKLLGQSQETIATHLFRIYEDNDFLNVRGNGTDNSYTNGLRLELFYAKNRTSPRFIDRLIPRAGNNSINIAGWSISQLMVTPNDITTMEYQPNDYPYAGALFVTRSQYSYNTANKYSFRTELITGIRGPASFAKQFQTYIHTLINYDKPQGWDNQLKTYALVNIDFAAEKQLLVIGRFFQMIGGAQLQAGSYIDAVGFYSLVRIGKMSEYFEGYLNQHGSYYQNGRKRKTQYYLLFKPGNTFVFHNALVHGARLVKGQDINQQSQHERAIRHRLTDIQFGAEIAHGNLGLSYLQTHSTEFNKGLYRHNWGNISLYFRW